MPHSKSILEIEQISPHTINRLIQKAFRYKKKKTTHKFKNKIIGNLFFEPSTRTCGSFESAIYRGGGNAINFHAINSSIKKGESLDDTVKTMEQYCDVLIIRDSEKGSMQKYSQITTKPIINAGDGNGEHPTQALLDLFTIVHHFHIPGPITITFCGDLKNSRTCHSLIKLLDRINPQTKFYFVSCDELRLSDEFLMSIKNMAIICNDLASVIQKTDVLYMTRLQKERMSDTESYAPITLTKELLDGAPTNMILMHPLPRNEEIPVECDANPRSKYFEQMENGVYMRMAILNDCFKKG